MSDASGVMAGVLKDLEAVQSSVGKIQLALVDVLVDPSADRWDDVAQPALVSLETVQRELGDVQVAILREGWGSGRTAGPSDQPLNTSSPEGYAVSPDAPASERAPSVPGRLARAPDPPSPARLPQTSSPELQSGEGRQPQAKGPEDKVRPSLVDPRAWLEGRGLAIKGVREPSPLDLAADRLASYLGDHFEALQSFYEHLKRTATGFQSQWFSLHDTPTPHIGAICHFGGMLQAASFLSEFRYFKRECRIRVVPLDDGRVKNFVTGMWLERYVATVVRRTILDAVRQSDHDPVLGGARVELPNGEETEIDVLAGLPGCVLWLECKTGEWTSYSARFRDLNERVLRLPPTHAGLVTLTRLDAGQRAAAQTLIGMTVMHLTDCRRWIEEAVGSAANGTAAQAG